MLTGHCTVGNLFHVEFVICGIMLHIHISYCQQNQNLLPRLEKTVSGKCSQYWLRHIRNSQKLRSCSLEVAVIPLGNLISLISALVSLYIFFFGSIPYGNPLNQIKYPQQGQMQASANKKKFLCITATSSAIDTRNKNFHHFHNHHWTTFFYTIQLNSNLFRLKYRLFISYTVSLLR